MRTSTRVTAIVASATCLLLVGPALGGANGSETGGVATSVRKTVLVLASADGTINANRMFTQVTATGTGSGTVLVPVGNASPRNLDGFGNPAVDNGSAAFNFSVDGNEQMFRTVNDNPSDPPVKVTVTVKLDGQVVSPADIVGKSGALEVTYDVVNTTTRDTQISYTNTKGESITETVPVSVAMGGAVDITLPPGFSKVEAPGANIGGDGRGGTSLSYSLVLFEPLGAPTAKVVYKAQIQDGSMPAADFTFLPIIPLDNSTVAGAKSAYEGGAETGATIADAGTQIGDNLIKLADGAGLLLGGLEKLDAGAVQLSSGLSDQLAPGAQDLADGLVQLEDGLGQLDEALPGAVDGVTQLIDGIKEIRAALGKPGDVADPSKPDEATLFGVINGLTTLSNIVKGQVTAAQGKVTSATATAEGIQSDTVTCTGQCQTDIASVLTDLGAASGSLAGAQVFIGDGSTEGTNLLYVIQRAKGGVADLKAALGFGPPKPGVLGGLRKLRAGLVTAVSGVTQLYNGSITAADGAQKLADGAASAADGSVQIADGLGQTVPGATQIQDGAMMLNEQGAVPLAQAGADAQAGFAKDIAYIDAVNDLALSGAGIPFGPSTGVNVTTAAYQFQFAAVTAPDSRDGLRYILGLVVLILAGVLGAVAWRRRATA